MSAIEVPKYELIRSGKWGRLLKNYTYTTPISGYSISWSDQNFKCVLQANGELTVFSLSVWDFGSGPAINTPAMVYASLAHDAFCHMTDRGLLPWSVRAQADQYFWTCLSDAGATVSRYWRVPAVMLYSQTLGRWRRKK
jgi:hypothetical protein